MWSISHFVTDNLTWFNMETVIMVSVSDPSFDIIPWQFFYLRDDVRVSNKHICKVSFEHSDEQHLWDIVEEELCNWVLSSQYGPK